MFGLSFEKLLIIGVVAVFLIGPERLPRYTAQLAKFVRTVRDMANGAKDRMREEMGPDFEEVDWKKLDPRQYDPRRIIREALLDDSPIPEVVRPPSSQDAESLPSESLTSASLAVGSQPPFDSEAT